MKKSDALTLSSEIFTRGVDRIIGEEALRDALQKKKKLKIKLGIDATAPFLHIGHATTLWKLRALQEYGHKVQLLLGDFTTRIGDPTGRSKTRPVIPQKEIDKNAPRIQAQVKKILIPDKNVLEFRRNSEWFGAMKAGEFMKILSFITHARLIERDMFRERIRKGDEIYMHEFLYPVLQGYDSYMLKSDCTIVGSDQLFNEAMGRFFQEKLGTAPQAIVTLTLLPGLDGKEKMSKSEKNYIAIEDSPREKFGKTMTLPDALVCDYMAIYTDIPLSDIEAWRERVRRGENPMQAKLFLACAIVRRYHGEVQAKKEKEHFMSLFSKKEISDGIPAVALAYGDQDGISVVVGTGAVSSRSEARRLITQGAVEVDGEILGSRGRIEVKQGIVIRVGKKRFYKVK